MLRILIRCHPSAELLLDLSKLASGLNTSSADLHVCGTAWDVEGADS